jgi:hypothetical protein
MTFPGEPSIVSKYGLIALGPILLSATFFSRYKGSLFLLYALISLALYILLLLLFNHSDIRSSLISVMALINLSTLVLLSLNKKIILRRRDYQIFYWSAWLFMLVWYIYEWMFISATVRPDLFVENNFEVPIVISLYVICFRSFGHDIIKPTIALVALVVISGSLSSLIIMLAVTGILFFNVRYIKYILFALPFIAFILPDYLRGLIEARIFYKTGGIFDLSAIDRFQFYLAFSEVVIERGLAILPSVIIYPLPVDICQTFAFYEQLIADPSANHCYSVVLHAGLLRMILDYGVMITILYFCAIYLIVRRYLSISESLSIVAIYFLSSLSISGVYSGVCMLSIFLLATGPEFEYSKSRRPKNLPTI